MSFSGFAPVRDDFRCGVCRQKNVFHCEHDTPYRDRYLGAYEQEKPYMASTNSQRESHHSGSHNNKNHSTNSNGTQNTNNGRNVNAIVNSKYQPGNKSDNHSSANANGSLTTDEQKKKNKSCVIL
jgi:hypothetical protein